MCNDKINKHERHDSANFLGLSVRNLKICKAKSSVSDPYPRWLTSNTFFLPTEVYFRPQNAMLLCSNLSHKSSLNLTEIFLAYICKEKNYVFADLHFVVRKNNWVRKSQIRKLKKYMVRKLQIRKLPHLLKVRKSKK